MKSVFSKPLGFGAPLALGSALWLAASALGQVADAPRLPSLASAELFTHRAVWRIRIDLDSDAMASLRQKPRKFVLATVTEENTVYPQVGVHLKGSVGSFRTIDAQPSLTLDFCLFKEGRKFHGLRRIHLNSSLEDPSFVNEKIGSELFQAAGVPAPRVTHALVALNGRALGLYVLKEGFTEDFLACHFKPVQGGLYESEGGHDIDQALKCLSLPAPSEDQAAFNALATAALEPDLTHRWQRLESVLDSGRFIAFMAMEVMLGHRDGYCLARNNFRVYHNLNTDKIVFFPHGMDQLLGTADLPWQPSFAGLVAAGVMATPEGKQLYAVAFRSLFTNVFITGTLTSRVDQIVQGLRPYLRASEWSHLKIESAQVKERIVQRQLSLKTQLSRPPLKLMEFIAGVSHLDGWLVAETPVKGQIDQVTGPDNQPALHILAGAETTASWSARALVKRGRYRFEGRGRVASVQPLPNGAHPGARVRVRGSPWQGNSLTGDTSWLLLTTPFQVEQAAEEVEFICELRARAGEAWFDINSLQVARIGDL